MNKKEELKAVNFKLPKTLRIKLRVFTDIKHISYNSLFAFLLEEFFDKEENAQYLKGVEGI